MAEWSVRRVFALATVCGLCKLLAFRRCPIGRNSLRREKNTSAVAAGDIAMKRFNVRTSARAQMVNITAEVQAAVDAIGIGTGTATVFIPHTTAGVTINENADPDVVSDILAGLEKFVPWNAGYRHNEGNSAAHIKASLMGSSVRVAVEDGRLQLGTWQAIYFCEFDGPRSREVWVA